MPTATLLVTELPPRPLFFAALRQTLEDRAGEATGKRKEIIQQRSEGDGSTDIEELATLRGELFREGDLYEEELRDTGAFQQALEVLESAPPDEILGRLLLVQTDEGPEGWLVYANNGEFGGINKEFIQTSLEKSFGLPLTLLSVNCDLVQEVLKARVPRIGQQLKFVPRGQEESFQFKVLAVS